MTREQITMDLEIVEIELRRFYLLMEDHWGLAEFKLDNTLKEKDKELTNKYVETYKTRPQLEECRYHNDVVELKKKLEKELKNA